MPIDRVEPFAAGNPSQLRPGTTSKVRRRSKLALLVTAALLSAPLGTATAPATALTDAAGASTCSRVIFVGVRGSGETSNDSGGYGSTIDEIRASFVEQMYARSRIRTVKEHAVDYTAASVDTLQRLDFAGFMSSIDDGGASLKEDVRILRSTCPDAVLVMAGYSQGAIVVHDVLRQWNEAGDRDTMAHIAGIALVADPYNKIDRVLELGDAAWRAKGIATRWLVARDGSLPSTFKSPVFGVCASTDLVCDYATVIDDAERGRRIAVHTSYADKHKDWLDIAATHLVDEVLTYAVPVDADLTGEVGVPFSAQLSMDPTPERGRRVAWRKISGDVPGLAFFKNRNAPGTIDGQPTTPGDYSVAVSARAGGNGLWQQGSVLVHIVRRPEMGTAMAAARVGRPYHASIPFTGGVGPWTVKIVSGALPAGLAVSGTDVTGTPMTPGSSTFTAKVTDSKGVSASGPLTVVVSPAETLLLTSPLITDSIIDAASDGHDIWAQVSGLPGILRLDATTGESAAVQPPDCTVSGSIMAVTVAGDVWVRCEDSKTTPSNGGSVFVAHRDGSWESVPPPDTMWSRTWVGRDGTVWTLKNGDYLLYVRPPGQLSFSLTSVGIPFPNMTPVYAMDDGTLWYQATISRVAQLIHVDQSGRQLAAVPLSSLPGTTGVSAAIDKSYFTPTVASPAGLAIDGGRWILGSSGGLVAGPTAGDSNLWDSTVAADGSVYSARFQGDVSAGTAICTLGEVDLGSAPSSGALMTSTPMIFNGAQACAQQIVVAAGHAWGFWQAWHGGSWSAPENWVGTAFLRLDS